MADFICEFKLESYIASPYWPELNDLVNIEKKAGLAFQRTEEKRLACIKGYLEKNGLDMDHYNDLKAKAARRWYRINPDDDSTEIVIPRHQLSGAMVQTCNVSPSSVIKTSMSANLRTLVRITDFLTGKTTHDEVFRRYVKGETSNQRRYQEDFVIKNFVAKGVLTFDPEIITTKTVIAMFKYLLENVGVGGCRKMGYGRGNLIRIEQE